MYHLMTTIDLSFSVLLIVALKSNQREGSKWGNNKTVNMK